MQESPPYEFLCCITLGLMVDPVVALDGNTYERTAIEGWFRQIGYPTSPLTRQRLPSDQLLPNNSLRKLICDFRCHSAPPSAAPAALLRPLACPTAAAGSRAGAAGSGAPAPDGSDRLCWAGCFAIRSAPFGWMLFACAPPRAPGAAASDPLPMPAPGQCPPTAWCVPDNSADPSASAGTGALSLGTLFDLYIARPPPFPETTPPETGAAAAWAAATQPLPALPAWGETARVALRSRASGLWLCAEQRTGRVCCDRPEPGSWEIWQMVCVGGGSPGGGAQRKCLLRSHHGRHLCIEPSGKLVADRVSAAEWEEMIVVPAGGG